MGVPKIRCVLVVDDDDTCLDLMSGIFKRNGIDVHKAHSGEEATIELKSGLKFDAVITDIMMPGMNGYQLCEYVGHEMPVLLVSALGRDAVAPEYMDLSDAFITKSQMRKHLVEATEKAVDRWSWAVMGPIAA